MMNLVTKVAVDCGVDALRGSGEPIELPSEYNEYGVMVDVMRGSGALRQLNSKVLVRRAGSFELVDLVLFLTCFFSASSSDTSLAAFAQATKHFGNELAALGDRVSWLTQASLSRGLSAVDIELARDVARCLFAISRQAMLQSKLRSATGYRDGTGMSWSVYHWDTTADSMRRRALPEGDELPDAIRLGDDLAAPGYAGRKRGEGVFSRSIVSDATTSIWIHMDLCSGSGSVTDHMRRAVEDTLTYVTSSEELARTVMVCDGVSGGLPQTRAVLQGGMHVLTRISRYEFLQTTKARKLIEKANWRPVEDSRSGPRREAIDLGTHRVDGHQLRIIASRFSIGRSKKKGRGAGTTIDGYHYELFHSSLPAEGWAANDLVTLYYGRTAIENRFAAEDREFDLSRVFSFSAGGQLLASAVAMTLWNLRVVAGIASVSEATAERRSRPRDEGHTTDIEAFEETALGESVVEESVVDETGLVDESGAIKPYADQETLIADHVERFLARHPNWSGDAKALQCPVGTTLKRSVRERERGLAVRFRAPSTACIDCPMQSQCTTSVSPQFSKEVTFQIGVQVCHDEPTPTPSPTIKLASAQPTPPAFLPDAPTLRPSVLRRRASQLFATLSLSVLAPEVKEPDPTDEHIAIDIANRQRRRQSIAQRVAANARPEEHAAATTLLAPPDFLAMFARLKLASRSA